MANDGEDLITKLAASLGNTLEKNAQKVSAAESCTGGGVCEAITRIPGSSCWFEHGFVTYSNGAKSQLLGVDDGLLAREGAVSQAAVEQMAKGALRQSGADIAVGISGIAGPDGGTADKPVGTVWFAWASNTGEAFAEKHVFSGDRQAVREQSVIAALQGLIKLLGKTPV